MLKFQLHKVFNNCGYYLAAVDESMDITSTAQMSIFARNFAVTEELANLSSA
jgi:hypothetical protein